MGLFDRMRDADALSSTALPSSPWQPESALANGVVVAEAMGVELSKLPLTRETAMGIPAAARCRNLLVSAVASQPLVALTGDERVKRQPSFLSRSDSLETPYDRMAWTVDDLFWHAKSLWAVARGSKSNGSAYGPILDAVRIPYQWWSINPQNRICVQTSATGSQTPVPDEDVLLFQHPSHGMLRTARQTLRAAEAIETAYVDRARNPIPITVIRYQQGAGTKDELAEDEVKQLLSDWREARSKPGGSVGYLPPQLIMETPGERATDMLQEARNAVRIDVANHANLPVHMLDGGVAQESMTYRNGATELNRFFVESLPYWLNPIEQRLSRDDVVPRGQRIRFDLAAFDTPAPPSTGVPTDD